jgi:hypothetical protein
MEKKTVKPAVKLKLGASATSAKTAIPPAAKRALSKATAAPVAPPAVAVKKSKRPKVVRDSFTMPKGEYAKIDELKALGLTVGVAAKKSELLRAGLIALGKFSAPELKAAIKALDNVKTGRPS